MEKLQKLPPRTQQKDKDIEQDTMIIPPIRTLLERGPPNQTVLAAYIEDLDSHLDENSRRYMIC
jgi:redox-regulated HSP33 family molecular chaperone